jgi:cell division protein FtsL
LTKKKKGFELNLKTSIFIVLGFILISFILFFPKIYLRNNIYYISKDINRLYAHYISLKEENKFLKQQLEDTKFKNQIIDSINLQEEEEE